MTALIKLQPIFTPPISKCSCGAEVRIEEQFDDFRGWYQCRCANNHVKTKPCKTVNRAIHRWNNRNQFK